MKNLILGFIDLIFLCAMTTIMLLNNDTVWHIPALGFIVFTLFWGCNVALLILLNLFNVMGAVKRIRRRNCYNTYGHIHNYCQCLQLIRIINICREEKRCCVCNQEIAPLY